MKTIKQHLKRVAHLLVLLMLVQACTVYKGKSVSLDRAVDEVTKTELVTTNDVTHKFKRIVKEDGHYYGIKKSGREMIKVPIAENRVKAVRLHDKTLSAILSIGIPAVLAGAIIYGLSYALGKGVADGIDEVFR